MKERLRCEFFLIRYVPDVVKGEFVNIGVLLREAAGGAAVRDGSGDLRVKFTRDWSRVRCMDAEADVSLLEALEGEIAARVRVGVSAKDPKTVMEVLEDSLSNSVQMTEARGTLAENMTAGMDDLMRMYVEPLKVAKSRVKSGRATLQGAMRTEFERAGVWGLMRKRIAASSYTRAGDPLRIDCGYRGDGAAGLVRMFQAVSLDGDVDGAKGLAFSAPRLRDGVSRVEGTGLELTAVIEPWKTVSGGDEALDRYRFGVEAMEREAIRVVTVADLARVAETARRELGV